MKSITTRSQIQNIPTSAPGSRLPVSKKFYASLRERVATALAIVRPINSAYLSELLMEMIDRYMRCGAVPDKDGQTECVLVFHILRQEIDKAISRSRSARASAARRKAAKVERESNEASMIASTVETDIPSTGQSNPTDDASPTAINPPKSNRRQRSYSRRCFQ